MINKNIDITIPLLWGKFSLLNSLVLIIITSILIGCNSDNFYETKRIIETDKNEYKVGDTIHLTLKIIPLEKEKEIRIYKNFKNLEISFAIVNDKIGVHNEDWSERSGENLPKIETEVFKITKEKPFSKSFLVPISQEKEKIILKIPELKLKVDFDINKVSNNSVRIHGFCNPINPELGASLEEYFETKDIKITKL